MNVLIVTHSYAPDRSPRAFRWTAIAEHWAGHGARVDVVTTGRGGGAREETRGGVRIHRAGERVVGELRHRNSAIGGGGPQRPAADGAVAAAKRLAKAVYNATWKKLYWPDYACLWYRPALREAKRLWRANRYDAVISVSHPFTGHLIGLSLKRAFPAMRWVVDVGDPFSLDDTVPSNNPVLYRRLNRRVDTAVFRHCDVVSVTVAGCKSILSSAFPTLAGKTHVIPPLLSLAPAPAAHHEPLAEEGTINLVYLGVLYAGIRRPDSLLALFAAMHARMNNLRLHFFGDIQGCGDAFTPYAGLMDKAILVHGAVPRDRVGAIMVSADVLVNIGNDTPHQLPSKLVEYAGAGRPIVNLSRSDTDTAAAFLNTYPSALSITGAGAPSDADIGRVLDFVANPPVVDADALDSFIVPFRVDRIAREYARLVTDGAR